MGKKKKKVPGLNQSSTADISFILLIFFLITTSMDTDMGLARRLPRPPEENQEDATMDIKSRNILYVRMNSAGQLWVKDEMESGYAYNELRNELSKQKFGRPYDALGDEEKVAVRAYYPQNISEAEPKKYGGQK